VKGDTGATGSQGLTGPQGLPGDPGPPGPSAITTRGDLAVGDAAGVPTRLPIGANFHMLRSSGTDPYWSPDGALQRLYLGGAAEPFIQFAPTSGSTFLFVDRGTSFDVENQTDGTTPLAIQSDRVQISGERFLELVRAIATLRLTSPTGHQYDLTAGGTGSLYPQGFWIANVSQGAVVARLGPIGYIFLNIAGDGLRQVLLGGVDSGGAGYRALITPNNPTG
jgi:hypothetical protein